MRNIIKIEKNKLSNQNLGNFLYNENDELYFCDKLDSAMFEQKKDNKKYDKTLDYSMDFNSYVEKFLNICANTNNKPSLMFLNCAPDSVKILNEVAKYNSLVNLESDENFEIFNKEPSYTCVQTGVINVLKKLVETRSERVPQNNVFVFFNEPEKYSDLKESPGIDTILTICRSRKIYFVFNFVDPSKFIEKYGIDMYETIASYCPIKFICDNVGVVDIQLA